MDYVTCQRCNTLNALEPVGRCAGTDPHTGERCSWQWYLLGAPERFPRLFERLEPRASSDARIPEPGPA